MKHTLMLFNNLYKTKKLFSVATIIQRKNFSISRWYAAPFGNHVSANDPKILVQEREILTKIKSRIKSAPGWNEFLASDSEAIVKAEREDHSSIEELQRQTVEFFHEEKKN
ncbi:11298_t:CDS:2 [Ambispora gerdemannii]|uniref:11298_t:CDS:1 n=1 Tax=Ambispora gerdemannii TaxID=144530 RepID=A0A9N9CTJ4_9GLOM|nr:11298_t:CDS:2 [Ambispora gerdemannii]